MIKGILCPSMTNSFKERSLERSYLTYSHRQRQKSLIIVNLVDFLLKLVLALIWIVRVQSWEAWIISTESITWSVCCCLANLGICFLGLWRCFANNYLHWAATCTWLLLNLQGFIGAGLGFAQREYLVWYILFIIFVPYAMLPLPLKWCMTAGSVTAMCHLIVISIEKFQKKSDTTCLLRQLVSNLILYAAINFAGMYTKYLTDRGQRLAFIETHKAMEHKKESEKEYQRTQKLLDSSECIRGWNLCPYCVECSVSLMGLISKWNITLIPKCWTGIRGGVHLKINTIGNAINCWIKIPDCGDITSPDPFSVHSLSSFNQSKELVLARTICRGQEIQK